MIASQVAGKATRDALFLSNFAVTSLPAMMVAAAVISLAAVLLASRTMALYGPNRIVPLAFAASGLALIGEWQLYSTAPEAAAVLVYLHETVVGSILISGFWSLVNESFPQHLAKRSIAYFGCAGTAGGLIGCALAHWVAMDLSVSSMLALLAGMHLACAWFVRGLRTSRPIHLREEEKSAAIKAESRAFGYAFRVLRRTSYARNLALLIMLAASTAVFVNYVFKAETAAVYQGDDLLRFFSGFYMVASLLTFLVQSMFSQIMLERVGGPRTVAALPAAVGISAALGSLFPGLSSAIFVGGIETVLRNSLFRAGYESLYVPLSRQVKRSTKSIIDVGFDRIGNIAGAGLIHLFLLFNFDAGGMLILAAAALLSIFSLGVTFRLRRGYVDALEKRLLNYSQSVEGEDEPRSLGIGGTPDEMNPLEFVAAVRGFVLTHVPHTDSSTAVFRPGPVNTDPITDQFRRLRSGRPELVKEIFEEGDLNPLLAPQVIQLLPWSDVSEEAVTALERIAPAIEGLLADALLDSGTHPRGRSCAARILGASPSPRAIESLMRGITDPVFDVRFNCGRALARIRAEKPAIAIPPDAVYEALRRELESDGFSMQRAGLLEKPQESYLTEGMPLDQVNWQLEHAFMVLSLVVSQEPLKIAFRGLHSMEEAIRATAVEYLASLLPGQIRPAVMPAVERIARQF